MDGYSVLDMTRDPDVWGQAELQWSVEDGWWTEAVDGRGLVNASASGPLVRIRIINHSSSSLNQNSGEREL